MIIDFHAHILPGVDHGSNTIDDARKQLAYMRSFGVDSVVATSHFYPHMHRPDEFIKAVDMATDEIISSSVVPEGLSVYVGAEVLVCENIHKMSGFEKLCIRGTKCILLEMPAQIKWSKTLLETVETIIEMGFTVVLAHIDRYIHIYKDEIDILIEKGALAQVNSGSLVSFTRRKKILPYIKNGLVVALGSDLHGPDKSVCKEFSKVKKIIGDESYDLIMQKTEKLLENAQRLN